MKPLFQSLLIFDLANLVWRNTTVKVSGEELTTRDGVRTGHIYRTLNSILAAKRHFGGSMYFVTEGMEVDRYRWHPKYKAGRATIKDEFNPFPDIMELISYVKASLITPVGAEADDGIFTLCQQHKNAKITVISSDRDLWACLGGKVTIRKGQDNIYQAAAQKEFDVSDVRAIPLVKALRGDKSDNIPSVPRLKWADIREVMQNCLTPDDLYGKIDTIANEKTRNKLIEYEQQVRTMFKVTTLRICEYETKVCTGDLQGLTNFLLRYECKSLVDKVGVLTESFAP